MSRDDLPGSTTRRGYGYHYQQARARLLAGGPPCHWCGRRADTADHWPPKSYGGALHDLVPACRRCNYGHVALKRWRELNGLPTPPRRPSSRRAQVRRRAAPLEVDRGDVYPGPSRDWWS